MESKRSLKSWQIRQMLSLKINYRVTKNQVHGHKKLTIHKKSVTNDTKIFKTFHSKYTDFQFYLVFVLTTADRMCSFKTIIVSYSIALRSQLSIMKALNKLLHLAIKKKIQNFKKNDPLTALK